MKSKYVLCLVLLFLITINTSADVETSNNVRVNYERRVVQGNDHLISMRIDMNMSSLDVTIRKLGDTDAEVLIQAKFETWAIADIYDFVIPSTYYEQAGEYRVGIVVKPQNSTFAAVSMFFDFVVIRVFSAFEAMTLFVLILFLNSLVFIYDLSKKKMNKSRWNNLTFVGYLKAVFLNNKFLLVLFIMGSFGLGVILL